MRYLKFVIRNYRAIAGPLEVDVDRRSLLPIIGINEAGKTTVLQAIFAFDHYNDDLNQNGRHLENTANLYRTASPAATVTATVSLSRAELLEVLDDVADDGESQKTAVNRIKKKRRTPGTFEVTRNLSAKTYTVEPALFATAAENHEFGTKLVGYCPYILFFDDFRDKVDHRVEIKSPEKPAGWLAILERLFKSTDPSFSVFSLASMEERRRKSVLAKVQAHLNRTLTREWQNFRLDDRDSLELSLDFEAAAQADGAPQLFVKLSIVETDASGDKHYFYISDRSKGFFWFFNFVMKLEFNAKVHADNPDGTIYLLDEPGSYLHASAQAKLCSKLRVLAERNRVIYCTHSHYLLNPEVIPLGSVLVADKDANGEIRLVPIYEFKGNVLERRGAFQPIVDALQIKPFLLCAFHSS